MLNLFFSNSTKKQHFKKEQNMVKRLFFGALIVVSILIFFMFSKENSTDVKPFFQQISTPTVIAHRGGSAYPENTLPAFWHSIEIGADVIEFDVHMTKDGHLVVIHDSTVDRTTNGTGKIDSFTLAELKQLDAGYHFNNQQFRGQGISIPTVEEVFELLPNAFMNIEIKDSYLHIEEKLSSLIQQYQLEDKVLVASFDQNIINRFIEVSNGKVAVTGGKKEVTKFVLLHKLFLSWLYKPKVDAFQIPTEANSFRLDATRLIKRAKQRNIPLYYWTINDKDEMEQLLTKGATGIITDKPDVLIALLVERGIRE